MIESGSFLGRLLGPPLIKSVIKPLVKNFLIPSGLTVAASAADTGVHKKTLASDCRHSSLHLPSSSASHNNAMLIISNDEMKDIIAIVKSLEDSGLL